MILSSHNEFALKLVALKMVSISTVILSFSLLSIYLMGQRHRAGTNYATKGRGVMTEWLIKARASNRQLMGGKNRS